MGRIREKRRLGYCKSKCIRKKCDNVHCNEMEMLNKMQVG